MGSIFAHAPPVTLRQETYLARHSNRASIRDIGEAEEDGEEGRSLAGVCSTREVD